MWLDLNTAEDEGARDCAPSTTEAGLIVRVLHLVNYVNESGNGITNVVVDLAVEQARDGHVVCVASNGGAYELLLEHSGVETRRLDFTQRHPLGLLRARAGLVRLVREVRPDVVHTHTLTPTALTRSMCRRPPLVATVHNEYQRGVGVMAAADLVVGVSEAVSRAMRARHVPARRSRTVLNGTIGSARRDKDLPPAELASPAVVALGAISPRKGSDILVDAFEQVLLRVPEAHLYLVGDHNWPGLAARMSDLPWRDHLHLEGFVPQPQVYLSAADVFVLPSRREPLGLVLLEALEVGCPIVASDVDGIPEALDHGRAGVLVPVGAPAELAEAITRILTDPMTAAKLRASALEHSANFSVRRMALEYGRLYDSIVRG